MKLGEVVISIIKPRSVGKTTYNSGFLSNPYYNETYEEMENAIVRAKKTGRLKLMSRFR